MEKEFFEWKACFLKPLDSLLPTYKVFNEKCPEQNSREV